MGETVDLISDMFFNVLSAANEGVVVAIIISATIISVCIFFIFNYTGGGENSNK